MNHLSAIVGPTKDDICRAPARRDGRLCVSYPKSGRTWLRFALWTAGIDATLTHAGASTGWREIGRPYRAIPETLDQVPVVFLHRNPLDTAVSMFHQVHRRDLRRGSARWYRKLLPLALTSGLPPPDPDAFVLHPVYGVENVCRYNRLWLDRLRGDRRSLILTYEALRADPAEGFQRLLDHWGETGATGRDLAHAADMDRMRAAEQQGVAFLRINSARQAEPDSTKVRRGKVRGYAEELRPETIAAARAIAARYGFDA